MNQMSLFTDLPIHMANAPAVVSKKREPVQPNVDRPKTTESTPSIAAVAGSDSKSDQDTLLKLAGLIRQGREQMEMQARRRSRPVQSIGELAQAVLERHDLVARRREAFRRAAHQEKQSAMVGFADAGTQVHVAS